MITVKRQDALKWIKDRKLPDHLAGKIGVVMSRRHAKKWLAKLEDGTQLLSTYGSYV